MGTGKALLSRLLVPRLVLPLLVFGVLPVEVLGAFSLLVLVCARRGLVAGDDGRFGVLELRTGLLSLFGFAFGFGEVFGAALFVDLRVGRASGLGDVFGALDFSESNCFFSFARCRSELARCILAYWLSE